MLLLAIAVVVILFLAGVGFSMPALLVDVIGHLLVGRPDDVEGWCYYGSLLDKTGHHSAAVEAYRTALKLTPDYGECWTKLGDLLERMSDMNGANEAYGLRT